MNRQIEKLIPVAMLLALFLVVFSAGCVTPADNASDLQKELTLKSADRTVDYLKQTTADINEAAKEIAASSKDGKMDAHKAKQALADLYQRNFITMQAGVWDVNGQLIAAYPDNTKLGQNTDLITSMSDLVLASKGEVTSIPYMKTALGQKSLGFVVPVKQNESVLGYIAYLYDPYDLFGIGQNYAKQCGLNLLVIQKDGTQIYEVDVDELGTNLLTDDRFKEIRPSIMKIFDEKEGTVKYTFSEDLGTKDVEKTFCWTTITYGGQTWIIATTAEPGMPDASKLTPRTPTQTPVVKQNLTNKEVAKIAYDEILSRLQKTADDMKVAANTIVASSVNGSLDQHVTQQALATLYQSNVLACQLVSMDKAGKVVATYPNNVYAEDGARNYDEAVKIIQSMDGSIILGPYSEGPAGRKYIGLTLPLMKGDECIGCISFMYDPYDLFGDVQKIVKEYGLNLVVVQKDGVQIYDPDVWELGTNSIKDSRFDGIRETTTKVVAGGEGEETYEFVADGGNEKVTKTISWTTLNYGGQSWAVAVTEQK